MESILRAAWYIFGPAVLKWTVEELRNWGAVNLGAGSVAPIDRACSGARATANLDPDDGCYYWDFPEQEQ